MARVKIDGIVYCYWVKVDRKGRIRLPKDLQAMFETRLMIRPGRLGQLLAYKQEYDEAVRAKLPDVRNTCVTLQIDEKGRFPIPAEYVLYLQAASSMKCPAKVRLAQESYLEQLDYVTISSEATFDLLRRESTRQRGQQCEEHLDQRGALWTNDATLDRERLLDRLELYPPLCVSSNIHEATELVLKEAKAKELPSDPCEEAKRILRRRKLEKWTRWEQVEGICELCFYRGCPEDGIRVLQLMMQEDPERLDLEIELVNAWLHVGDFAQAASSSESLLSRFPACWVVAYTLGTAHQLEGRQDEAMAVHSKIMAAQPRIMPLCMRHENLCADRGRRYADIFVRLAGQGKKLPLMSDEHR